MRNSHLIHSWFIWSHSFGWNYLNFRDRERNFSFYSRFFSRERDSCQCLLHYKDPDLTNLPMKNMTQVTSLRLSKASMKRMMCGFENFFNRLISSTTLAREMWKYFAFFLFVKIKSGKPHLLLLLGFPDSDVFRCIATVCLFVLEIIMFEWA